MDELPKLLHEYSGPIGGAFGILATTGAFILKQWWADRKEQRAFDAEEKTKEKLLTMVEKSLQDRKEAELRTNEVLVRQVVVLENLLQSQRSTNGKLDKLLGLKKSNGVGVPPEAGTS